MIAVRVITDEVIAKNVKTETLCVGATCITEEQLIKLLNGQGVSSTGSENNIGSESKTSEVSPPLGGETSTTTATSTETISIFGDIETGSTTVATSTLSQ